MINGSKVIYGGKYERERASVKFTVRSANLNAHKVKNVRSS